MKIIDKTPLLNEKGELGFMQRIQGMLKYGFNWPSELQAQKAIINYFDRQLEKGYTLIRNYTLGKSGITVPIILLGPSGIHVIHVAYLKGRYEARADAWNVASGDGYKPAPDNLIQQTMRMAKAVRAFIERQGVQVPVEIEAVLIGGDPGLHIESVKPAIRVLMIDGVKSYVSNLLTAQPVLRAESVYEFTERLINPHPVRKAAAPAEAPALPDASAVQQDPVVARAQAIFKASEDVKPFNPADFDFAMVDDDPAFEVTPPVTGPAVPATVEPPTTPKPRPRRILGMKPLQLVILGGLALAFLCIMACFVAYYFLALA
jgi:hypothetical protein